jgi:hypothetical protein
MKRNLVILGAVLLLAGIAAAIVPMWIATAGMGLPASGIGAIVLMIVFCFGVGGGLMFLIFFSARRGYDDAAHRPHDRLGPDDPAD